VATAFGSSTPGELTVITYTTGSYTAVNPVSYQIGYSARNPNTYPGETVIYKVWTPVTTWVASNPTWFTIPGLQAGFYSVQIRDNASTPQVSNIFHAELTTSAPTTAPCNLVLDNLASTPPKAGSLGGGTLTGHLSGTQDKPVTIQLLQDGELLYSLYLRDSEVKDKNYNFTLPGVQSGVYNLVAGLNAQLSGTDGILNASRCDCFFPQGGTVKQVEVLPPDLEIGDQLVFLPWVQPTLTSVATGTEVKLGATLAVDPAVAAVMNGNVLVTPALAATGYTKNETVAATTARIYGPGEVMGLHQRAILGTTPVPDATGFSPLQLAAIEFQDEDLPWRYSTRKRAAFSSDFNGPGDLKNKPEAPLPWLFLLVLKSTEFTALPLTGPLPRVAVGPTAPLPSTAAPGAWVAQQELWAHVQVMAPLGDPQADPPTPPSATDLDTFLNKTLPARPDLAYSRLLSPRRLEANTAYTAFVLPALEAGRRAGLGLPPDATDTLFQHSAIPSGARSGALEFPVYFQWSFSTGSEEDFESLVAQLGSAQASTTAATAPSLAVPTAAGTFTLPMPALLVDAEAPAPTPADTDKAVLPPAIYLYNQLQPGLALNYAAGSRPVVTPPVYGRAYLNQLVFSAPTPAAPIGSSWAHRVNLDARYRTLAALGAQVVRTNQEEYVRRAWDQVQDILLANEKLRGAQYGLRTTAGLRDQHLPLATITTTTTTTTTGATGGHLATSFTSSEASFARVQASEAAVAEGSADAPAGAGLATLAGDPPQVSTSTATSVGMADYGLHLTGLALGRVRLPAADAQAPALTAREAIRRSSTPLAAFSPTFRRITKPFGNYVVGQAGRPLRPTQPEAAAPAAPTLREPGTSLRQRDVLLTSLAQGRLAATPPLPEQARTLQFADDRVDKLLLDFNHDKDAAKISISQLDGTEHDVARARLQAAFGSFVVQPSATTSTVERRVGFRKPQYKRPALALPELLAGVVTGTAPGPIFTKKIEHVAPTVSLPPVKPVVPGDFEAPDFNASHFYVGDDVEEPSHTIAPDWLAADFSAADFRTVAEVVYDDVPAPVLDGPVLDGPVVVSPVFEGEAALLRTTATASFATASLTGAATGSTTTSQSSTAASAAPPATDGTLPAIKQAKVFPVFKDPMGEPLRLLHPDLFVPGLGDFPASGVAVLAVDQAFIEAYMVGLNHALGSELSWRGFPVDLRGTFFQQFWDVSEHLNTTLKPDETATASQEAELVDITPIDQWGINPLGTNAPPTAPTALLRLAVRSELLRRYPNLVLALQLTSAADPTDPKTLLHPRQRLAVGQDMVIVTFAVDSLATAKASYSLLLMERPGQPKFGFDELAPVAVPAPATAPPTTDNPLSWNDLSVPYLRDALGFDAGENLEFYANKPAATTSPKPRATAEPAGVAYLTDGARVAYALFQEPILASLPLADIFA